MLAEPDGTFLPEDITKLLVYSNECDAVFGTRTTRELIWHGANMAALLRWGNWAVAKMIEALFNTSHLSDVGCTYKLLRRSTADHVVRTMKVGGSHAGVEIMLLTILSGARVVEIPVNYLPRVGRSSVTGDPLKAIGSDSRWWPTCFATGFWDRGALRDPPPLSSQERRMGPESMSSSHFDEIATRYDESLPTHVVEHYLRKRTAFIVENCPAGTALDVGCGTGALAERLSRAGYAVSGVDPSAGMLEVLRQRDPNIPAMVGSGTNLPFDGDRFSLVYCVAVMHHVADPGRPPDPDRNGASVRAGGLACSSGTTTLGTPIGQC